ncbi:RING-H2 finger protein atl13 [Phtheirospermum japonicum]|uniref:RING-type E3 ubiquitin transferase n=1 Tax=Phtheirospermum japonicum TaxID=374723 RepID=A0A830C6J5_9LAMI|nr:RING-H2 finger protein atl13 [Phtheirospermum japonicum]
MLLIIIILAVIFFISGVLHLLVRFLLRPPSRDPDEIDNVTALQGQLQQLFHLHDAGVDQSFIDTLPIFNYKAIIGVKDPFDCAVCLCEFESEDKLRLLPKCSHAFHMECIDTWLLSHSTCPLCRANLLADFCSTANCSPIVLVLEAGGESSREIVPERETSHSVARASSHLSDEFRDPVQKSCEEIQDESRNPVEKVVSVKLGKFRSVDGGCEGSGGDSTAEARRCFSMGSFAYVMDENSSLQVPIRTPVKKQSSTKQSLPLTPGHRPAMSECGCDSRGEFSGFEAFRALDIQSGENDDDAVAAATNINNKSISGSKKESFSVSKIWLRGKKVKSGEERMESSRRAFSFRFPVNRSATTGDEMKAKINGRRTISEIDMRRWENGGSEDEEIRSCNSLDSQANPLSFARRTFLWIMGRPNKVVHPSFSSNV